MRTILAFLLCASIALSASAADKSVVSIKPGEKDKCPVCGMFVYRYPDWTASVLYRDGTRLFFDGPKDLYKYLLDPARYAAGRRPTDIQAVQVTDYYQVRMVDAENAFYVVESDIYGPMGKELVPFERETDARSFLADHKGLRVIRHRDVTPDIIRRID